MDEWEIIVAFKLVAEADAEWQAWLKIHDISNVSPHDVHIDIGHKMFNGRRRDIRRYRIRKEAMGKVSSVSDEE